MSIKVNIRKTLDWLSLYEQQHFFLFFVIKYNNNISSNYHYLCFTEESRAGLGQHEDDLMVTEFSFLGNLSF